MSLESVLLFYAMETTSPKAERLLIWQVTNDREGYACSGCPWTFPNPRKLTEHEHDEAEVQRSFGGWRSLLHYTEIPLCHASPLRVPHSSVFRRVRV
jgi:hypothetical protein